MTTVINGTSTSASAPAVVGDDGDTGIFFPTANVLAFATNGTEDARFDASGNLLIGQTSQVANEKVLVRDNVAASTNIRIRNDSTSASAGAAIAMNASGNTWALECGSSAKNSNALTWLLDYSGTNQERLRLNTDGTLILRGGSTSATGTGITFPASQSASSDANTLDDYEEGTFTPSFTSTGISAVTYGAARNGYYTKIGNRVFITVNISTNSVTVTNSSAAVTVTGLPFTPSGATESGAAISIGEVSRWVSNPPSGGMIFFDSVIRLYRVYNVTASDPTQNTAGDMATGIGNNNTVRFTATYFV